MKKLLVIIAILLISTAVFAQNHFNQGMDCQKGQGRDNGRMGMNGKGHPGERMMMVMHQLELTEDQQDQMETRHIEMQKTDIEINSQIKILEIDAQVAMKEMNFSQIKKVSNNIFDLKKELKNKHIDNQEKCWNLLTAEQKEQAMELMKHPRKMMQEKMGEKKGMGHQRNRMMIIKWVTTINQN